MVFNIKQVVFSYFFIFSWLLLLLLGESYLDYILLGGISLFALRYSSQLDWSQFKKNKLIGFLWLLFLLIMIISLFFSTNLPLSLAAMNRYLFSFVVFWLFLLLKKTIVNEQLIIQGLLLVSLVVTLLSLVFVFVPDWAYLIPGKNLLYASYGHNHLAVLLLLIIPSSWWLVNEYIRDNKSILWLGLPLFFTVSLLISFGRVAVIIGMVQFFVIWQFWLKKNSFAKKKSHLINFLIKTIALFFSLALLTNIIFSTIPFVNPSFSCPVKSFEKQLCKTLMTETRPQYWNWAVQIIKDNPWMGTGPGTYGISSIKYHTFPYVASAYAHNSFLQAGAELGVLGGGLFAVLMFFLLWKAAGEVKINQKIKHEEFSWQKAILLGIVSVFFNAFFDFDWQFIGIFSLTLIFLALLIRNYQEEQSLSQKLSLHLFKLFYFGAIVTLLFFSSLYVATDYLIRLKQTDQAFNLFPYFHWHRKIYEKDSNVINNQFQKFIQIYQYHPDIYKLAISQVESDEQKQQLTAQLFEIDPWQRREFDLAQAYLNDKDWVAASVYFDRVINLWQVAVDKHSHEIDHNQEEKLADQMLVLADNLYQNNQSALAASWYSKAQITDNWVLDRHQPIFLTADISYEEKLMFFSSLSNHAREHLGHYQDDYALYYLEALKQSIIQDQDKELLMHVEKIIATDIRERWLIWETISSILIDQAEFALDDNQPEIAYQALRQAYSLWSLLRVDSTYNLNWEFEEKIAQLLIETGDHLLVTDSNKTKELYLAAQDLVPWEIDMVGL